MSDEITESTAWVPTDAEKAAAKPWGIIIVITYCAEVASVLGAAVYCWQFSPINSRGIAIGLGAMLLGTRIVRYICFKQLYQIRGESLPRAYWRYIVPQIAIIAFLMYALWK